MDTKQSGQGLIEYIFVIAVVAIIAIGVMGVFSETLRSAMSGVVEDLAEKDSSQERQTSPSGESSTEM